MRKFLLGLLVLSVLSGCEKKKELWIYTSIYKEVIAELEPELKKAMPDVEIQWFQSGSENVASKVNAELKGGRAKADLILSSDPFWYFELKRTGKLLCGPLPATAAEVPKDYADPDGCFVNVRTPVMVLGYNSEAVKPNELPERWKDLAKPQFKGKLSMGSPLESGTMFTAVALLQKKYGWDYFTALRANDLIAAGGNSSVITRIETKERPIGIVLLENILAAQKKGSPVRAIYPLDGAIPVPSPIAILKDSQQPELAKRVEEWFFTPQAQSAIVRGRMYAALPKIVSPDGARPWSELSKQMMPWSPEVLGELYQARDEIKTKFSELVLK